MHLQASSCTCGIERPAQAIAAKKSLHTSAAQKEFFFIANEANMCMKTMKTWTNSLVKMQKFASNVRQFDEILR
jgi:hypothetical protein